MGKMFVTSDTHFNHKNIAGPSISSWDRGYREFNSIDEMNRTIADNINSVVGENDILWHLGDFAFGSRHRYPEMRNLLNCRTIHLIYGNHDHTIKNDPELRAMFSSCQNYKQMKINGTNFVLMHYPLHVWDGHQHGAVHLHGHCHGNLPESTRKRMDVGVDVFDIPITFDYAAQLMQARVVEKVDHHDGDTN